MTIDLIITMIVSAIIAALPTICSCISALLSYLNNKKVIGKGTTTLLERFEAVREEVVKTKEYEELKALYKSSQEQYFQLLKAHRELLTKIDQIARKEEEYEGQQVH
jgi:uncharacterized protein YlxW (UPF0749 family)